MKITNNHNIPDTLYKAISGDNYQKNLDEFLEFNNIPADRHISCTSLIGPSQVYWLRKEHAEEITEDASDLLWRFYGTIAHSVLEGAAGLDTLSEERLFAKFGNWYVSGQSDLYEPSTRTLWDYKLTSVWSFIFSPGGKPEYEAQLNIDAYFWRKAGFTVDRIANCMMFRDWSERDSKQIRNYPKQVETIEYPLWTDEEVESFVQKRLTKLENHAPCTPEECWEKYRAMKTGRKTAVKNCKTREEAQELIDKEKATHIDVIRQKCEKYCEVAEFCEQYQNWRNNNELQ